jgi:hypothetical protein
LVRVAGPQVEVEYQSGRHLIASSATDVLQRALVVAKNPPTPAPATSRPSAAALAMVAPAPAASEIEPIELTTKEAAQRLIADVVRVKKSRVEGGDWDDKKERVELRVRMTNTDIRKTATKLKGEIYIFANSIVDKNAVKLLALEGFECKLPPRATHEMTTKEITTEYDTTDARFGFKYDSWLLRVRDNNGYEVMLKSNSPTMVKNALKVTGLTAGKSYDKSTFKEKEVLR